MHSYYIVFVDESGDHSLDKIDAAYPVFVLSFRVFTKVCYADVLTPGVWRLKFETFGHDMVVRHEADLVKKKNAFSRMKKEARAAFMGEHSALIVARDFTMIAIILDKAKYSAPHHLYHFGMQIGLERLRDFLAFKDVPAAATTHVICEARGAQVDDALAKAFEVVCAGDNRIRKPYLFELVMVDKKASSEGLQLADLTATDWPVAH